VPDGEAIAPDRRRKGEAIPEEVVVPEREAIPESEVISDREVVRMFAGNARGFHVDDRRLAVAAVLWGVLVGGTSGAGGVFHIPRCRIAHADRVR
jgi:hypothetical protein